MSHAIVLLSGGLDSATLLAFAKSQGFELTPLTFRYGQRHDWEVESSKKVAKQNCINDHVIVDIDLRVFGKSALTDNIEVPKNRSLDEMAASIPVTYVPARNTIFLSYALACAEVRGARDIFIGVNALDFDGYPDCRPEYMTSFEAMANLATKDAVDSNGSIKMHSPLIDKTKAQIIQMGYDLGVDYKLTSSCYEPSIEGVACGQCDACQLRLMGFEECGKIDPIEYQALEVSVK